MGKFNLNLLILILVVLVVIMQVRSCLSGATDNAMQNAANSQTNIIIQSGEAGSNGLDLESLGPLLNKAQDAAELEQLLNQKNGINNLDLNGDSVVDFIAVTEFGAGNERGFALSTEIAEGVEQEIATIRLQRDEAQQDLAQVQIQGNEALYGANTYYHSRIGLGDMLLFAWLFSPHRPYYSPFSWGYYPTYYGRGYGTVGRTQYRTRTATAKQNGRGANLQKSSKPQFKPQTASPKANSMMGRRSSLSNPNSSQRSFGGQNSRGMAAPKASSTAGRAAANGASGRSSLSNSNRSQRSFGSNSIRRSAGMRSGSSFGGGK